MDRGAPVTASVWRISFSWCGNTRSFPPPWMSMVLPRYFEIMAEHSMCHPGLPGPQGESHEHSPGFAAFHTAKSMGSRLFSSSFFRPDWTRSDCCMSSSFLLLSFP